tara:strand:+ start:8293 stop:9723 length:1431 start_codon:yes stop_codon:yes gene_type:complete
MGRKIKADICVIGAGSGGLSVAAGASQMGAKTVLVEAAKMGGDCLNYGCVPSKALLAAAKKTAEAQNAGPFGIRIAPPTVDFPKVMDHVAAVIAAIAPHDSVERFEGLGVTVIEGQGSFVSERELAVGADRIIARRFVIATGSHAVIPPIPGLADISYLTNETLFDLRQLPSHLIIIGGGPIGLEMAQAFVRLGSRVTVLEAATALARDDPELTAVVLAALRREGVDLREGTCVSSVQQDAGGELCVTLEGADGKEVLAGSHLLVATGRGATVAGLNLEVAGIEYSPSGIKTDARLRTTNRKIFAIGDVAGGPQFTHAAGYQAGVVIRNALFRLPAKASYEALPHVTYTDPELASVGLTEDQARDRHGDKIRVLTCPFSDIDRARTDRLETGLIKVVTGRGGRILGAGIVGPHAGELIHPWALAISGGLKISAMASYIAPYPTLGEIGKRAAGSYYTPGLFSPRTRALVRFLSLFG